MVVKFFYVSSEIIKRVIALSVSYETILNKIDQQLQLAKKYQTSHKALQQHINRIYTLCELILEEDGKQTDHKQTLQAYPSLNETRLADDDANGDSIFDF